MGEMTESGDWEPPLLDFGDVEFAVPSPDVAIIAYEVRQKVRMTNGKEQAFHAATGVRGADG